MKTPAQYIHKGFTLVELLIVIAILGILGAGVLVAIDPVDKVNAANDSRVQNDIGAMATAAEAYAAVHDGFYPLAVADIGPAGSGDLKVIPTQPTGYNAYSFTGYTNAGGACVAGTTCNKVVIYDTLKSKRFVNPGTPLHRYESATGKTCQVAAAGTTQANTCP